MNFLRTTTMAILFGAAALAGCKKDKPQEPDPVKKTGSDITKVDPRDTTRSPAVIGNPVQTDYKMVAIIYVVPDRTSTYPQQTILRFIRTDYPKNPELVYNIIFYNTQGPEKSQLSFIRKDKDSSFVSAKDPLISKSTDNADVFPMEDGQKLLMHSFVNNTDFTFTPAPALPASYTTRDFGANVPIIARMYPGSPDPAQTEAEKRRLLNITAQNANGIHYSGL